MNFLRKRALRRAQRFSEYCRNYIEKDKKILDIGLGNGVIAKQIKEDYNANIIGIDVIDYNSTDIPLILYDGKTIKFKTNNFDIVLIIEVLHHCEDLSAVLMEAKRVCRKKMIIFEDVYTSPLHRIITYGYDFLMNIRHSVNIPFNFKSEDDWRKAFDQLGLKLIVRKTYPHNPFYCPMKTRMFILEKNG